MTDLNKMRERLAFIEAEIVRTRPDHTAYSRYQRGSAPHPGMEVAGNAGYYSRRMTERKELRKGIKAAEEAAELEARCAVVPRPTQAEIEAALADLNARLAENEDRHVRRQRGLTEFIAQAMGQRNVLHDDEQERRYKLDKFIDYCFDEIGKIKEKTRDQQESRL